MADTETNTVNIADRPAISRMRVKITPNVDTAKMDAMSVTVEKTKPVAYRITHDGVTVTGGKEDAAINNLIKKLNGAPLSAAKGEVTISKEEAESVSNEPEEETLADLEKGNEDALSDYAEALNVAFSQETETKLEAKRKVIATGKALNEVYAFLSQASKSENVATPIWGSWLAKNAPLKLRGKNASKEYRDIAALPSAVVDAIPDRFASAKAMLKFIADERGNLVKEVVNRVFSVAEKAKETPESDDLKGFEPAFVEKLAEGFAALIASPEDKANGFVSSEYLGKVYIDWLERWKAAAYKAGTDGVALKDNVFLDESAEKERLDTIARGKLAEAVYYDELQDGKLVNGCNGFKKAKAQLVAKVAEYKAENMSAAEREAEESAEREERAQAFTQAFVDYTEEQAIAHLAKIAGAREDAFHILEKAMDLLEKLDREAEEKTAKQAEETDKESVGA